MKKLLACMLTLAMVASLFVGCSGNDAPASSQPSTPASSEGSSEGGNEGGSGAGDLNGKSLNIFGCLSQKEHEYDGWKAVADKFTQDYGVTVTYTIKGQWDEIPNNMTAAKLSGEQYDIVHTGVGLVLSSLAPAGICMDLTELLDPIKDRWNDGVLDTTTAGGKIWSMPVLDTGSSCIYVNQDMMDELGIAEFKTYDDMLAAAKTVAEKKNIMPMIHQGKAVSMWPMWFFEIYGQTTGDPVGEITKFLSGDTKFADAPEAVESFELLRKFIDDGILTTASLDTDRDGMIAVFLQQKAAMFYGGTWEYDAVKNGAEFNWNVWEFPQVVDGAALKHGGGPNGALIIPSFCDKENIATTAQYIEYFTRPENNQIVMDQVSPLMACMKNVECIDEPQSQKLNKQFVPNTSAFLDWIWPVKVNDSFAQVIPAVMNGSMTAAEATQNVQAIYDTLVKEEDYSYNWYDKFDDEMWAQVTIENIPTYEVK